MLVQVILATMAGGTHEAKVCAGVFDEEMDTEGKIKDELKDYIDYRGYYLFVMCLGAFSGFFPLHLYMCYKYGGRFKFIKKYYWESKN